MSSPSSPVIVGTWSGGNIIADLGGGLYPATPPVSVVLSADYTMLAPPGFPARPPAGAAVRFYPHTLLNGTTQQFLKPEADALIAAGAATAA